MQAQVLSAPPCGPGYSISVNSVGACSYNLEANVPNPNDVSYVQWFISSTGQNGRLCDQIYGALQQPYDFCFYGNYAIKAIIIFLDGSKCEINLTTNITCINSLPCNPNPGSQIDHPKFRYAWLDVGGCTGDLFMFWPITTNCNLFTYKLCYQSCNGYQCTTLPNNKTCFVPIYRDSWWTIKVTANHCCLPSNYVRYKSMKAERKAGMCTSWCAAVPNCSPTADLFPVDELSILNPNCANLSCFAFKGDEVYESRANEPSKNENTTPKFNAYSDVNTLYIQSNRSMGIYEIEIFDLQGKIVSKQKAENCNNGFLCRFAINKIPQGLYGLKIKSDIGTSSIKFVHIH
ncbi:MAG: T9SS type A sorting domain-containing protein [Saprospiraceae bacterium]|nr:T9SS type A sorting domain-containing protein [Saprospiraceae bacterium]